MRCKSELGMDESSPHHLQRLLCLQNGRTGFRSLGFPKFWFLAWASKAHCLTYLRRSRRWLSIFYHWKYPWPLSHVRYLFGFLFCHFYALLLPRTNHSGGWLGRSTVVPSLAQLHVVRTQREDMLWQMESWGHNKAALEYQLGVQWTAVEDVVPK